MRYLGEKYIPPRSIGHFTHLFISRPRDEYIATILKPSSWGGAIELSILAKHYSTEIDSVDVETGRIDHFTPPSEIDSGSRCVLVYSGIHYDAATIAPMVDAPADFHQTIIPRLRAGDEDAVLVAAKKLADKLRAKRAYTNTATFDLRCQVSLKLNVQLVTRSSRRLPFQTRFVGKD